MRMMKRDEEIYRVKKKRMVEEKRKRGEIRQKGGRGWEMGE